jgi:hypothetical protein
MHCGRDVIASLRAGDWRIIGNVLGGLQQSPAFRRGGRWQSADAQRGLRSAGPAPARLLLLHAGHGSPYSMAVRGCRHLPKDPAAVQHGLGP